MAFAWDASLDNGGDAANSVFNQLPLCTKPHQLNLKKLEEALSLFLVFEGLTFILNGPVGQMCS